MTGALSSPLLAILLTSRPMPLHRVNTASTRETARRTAQQPLPPITPPTTTTTYMKHQVQEQMTTS